MSAISAAKREGLLLAPNCWMRLFGNVALALWLSFRFAVPVGQFIGKTGVNIATRLMGLILAAVALEFITGGLVGLFPALAERG